VHEPPALHGTQVPVPLQTPPVHELPADLFVVAVHNCCPVPHAVTPFMHAFEGVHVKFGVHAEQVPLKQTRFVPQPVPLDIALPVSLQTGAPVPHAIVPVWQGLAGTQLSPLWHATQLPVVSQTMPVPHEVPGALLPLSLHTCVPVEHENVPTLQGLVG